MSIDSIFSIIKIILIVGLSIFFVIIIINFLLSIFLKAKKEEDLKTISENQNNSIFCHNSGVTMNDETIRVVSHDIIGTL